MPYAVTRMHPFISRPHGHPTCGGSPKHRSDELFVVLDLENGALKLYVGNLNFDTTEDSLRGAFAEHGNVEEVAIITDRDTGRPRGFAFVTMPNDSEAQAAIEKIGGTELDGRTLNVNQARERTGGGGGGGGRGGGRDRW